MPDVLSQGEIDELLKAISTGELDVTEVEQDTKEKKIRVYNFKRPNKFSKEQLRTFEMIHENYARLISTFLSGYLRSYVNVEVTSVEQLTYYEFTNSLANPTIMALSDFKPLSGTLILEINPSITFEIIDRVLGGQGKNEFKMRSFTEIELTIMENIVRKMLSLLAEPWKNVVEIYPKFEKIETNSQFAQILSPNETVALITMRLKLGEVEGFINLCIPHLTLEPIISKINMKYWFKNSGEETTEEDLRVLKQRLENAEVTLKVYLGKCMILVEDILDLQVGDVIQLDQKRNQPLEMFVDGRLKFTVKPGIKEKKIAVKVAEVLKKGEEAYE